VGINQDGILLGKTTLIEKIIYDKIQEGGGRVSYLGSSVEDP